MREKLLIAPELHAPRNKYLHVPINQGTALGISDSALLGIYSMMLRIRMFEVQTMDLIKRREIVCPCHLYIGEEAATAGALHSLRPEDFAYSNFRSHGHFLAKGGKSRLLMAELFGKATGCSGGHGGSMHLCAPDIGFPGSSAILAGSIPIAVGTALSFAYQGKDNVSVVFCGDGSATEGVFYESLNFASLKKLPVIFVCENNSYCTHMHTSDMLANVEIYRMAEAFNMPSFRIDGNNVVQIYNTVQSAVANARAGDGPSFIECITYRWLGHVGPNWDLDKGLRSQKEVEWWIAHCPIKRLERHLFETGLLTESDRENIIIAMADEIADAVRFARESPFPEAVDPERQVFR